MASSLADPEQDSRLCVLKFGGSVLTCETDFRAAGAETYRHIRAGEKAIVIVSAIAGETDTLLRQAEALSGNAANTARLARLGEYRSAALMGLELARLGVRTRILDPHEIGLAAEGDPLDADLNALDEAALKHALDEAEALVVPGFTAGHKIHGAVTLGRGGTDLTAVFFAARAGANRVRLIKDVDGVYSEDPAVNPHAARYDALDYDTALKASRGLIQPKAIEIARENGVVIEVAAMGAGAETRIAPCRPSPGRLRHRGPMRVALLGCGAVGSGVLDYLRGHPEMFALNPVLVRTPSKRKEDTRAAFTADIGEALDGGPHLVVELMGGADVPASIMQDALRADACVVTANKSAVARHYEALHACAGARRFAYSASVGGGVPVIERVAALKTSGIVMIEGVMNGTANFILDKLAAGVDFDAALAEAQRLGFAEADPSADVQGHDAADKLSILIREAFGVALPPESIAKQSLREVSTDKANAASANGLVYKQIGRCRLDGGRVEASVSIETVPAGHPLAGARNEENRFMLTDAAGRTQALYGKGAGRWPTAAAVFADIMEMRRAWAGDERVDMPASGRAMAALVSA